MGTQLKESPAETVRVKPDVYIASLLDEANDHLCNIEELLRKTCPEVVVDPKKPKKKEPTTSDLLQRIVKGNENFRLILDKLAASAIPSPPFYNSGEVAIAVGSPVQPSSPDQMSDAATGASGYQAELIFNTLQRRAKKITVINDGSAVLYVISSQDGTIWENESPILVGEARVYFDVWELRLRSEVAGIVANRQGGVYRVTEYDVWLPSLVFQPVTTLLFDDYESATWKFDSTITGAGVTSLSTDTAKVGSSSAKLVTGAVIGNSNSLTYLTNGFHDNKRVGAEISFATAETGGFSLQFELQWFPGNGTVHRAQIYWDGPGNALTWLDSNGVRQNLSAGVDYFSGIHDWTTIKIVIDLAQNTYSWVRFMGQDFSLAGNVLEIQANPSARLLHFNARVLTNAALSKTVYFDDFKFTDNEGVIPA